MAEFLPGAPVAERLTQDLKARSDALRQRGVTPTLAIIRVGRDPGGLAYEKGAASRCAKCGIDLRRIPLDDAASLPEVIRSVNDDPAIHGCLLLRPLADKAAEEAAGRLSWGQNGNERIGSFAYTSMMSQGKNAVINGKVYTGMLPSGYANADLKWETSEQTDLGIDLRFFNSALTFSADYFVKKTKDMLLSMPIPLYTSYGSMTVNSGTVKNEGIEFEASYRFKVGEVNLGINGNASYVKNTVTDQGPDRVGLNNIGGGMGGQVSWRENGRPYGFFYGYLHDGIFQNQQEIDSYTYVDSNGKTQLIQPNAKPGDIRFKDLDGKNGLNGDDRTMIGKPNPDWTYGFTLSADWKGLDFSAFFQGSIGNDIYKLYRRSNVTFGNYDKSWLNRWHGEGTSNWVPRVIDGDNNNYQVSNFFVEDGSYMRLKVLQIGYSLPGQMLQRVGVKGLRFFVQGENLFTITNYSGYDPEVGTRDGFDGGTYPQARTYTIGANITF